MGKAITLTLPIYYTFKRVRKKDKVVLVGINQMNIMHYIPRNEIKQHYHQLIANQLLQINPEPIKGKFQTRILIYYKNKQSDPSNIAMMIEKFMLDAFQEAGLIVNDNVDYHYSSYFRTVEQDRENPRVQIQIRGCNER